MKTLILSAVAALPLVALAFSATAAPRQSTSLAGTRVAIFYEPDFPAVDAARPDADALRAALAGFDVSILDAAGLSAALGEGRVDVLVLPFGSAFPQPAWPAIFQFLSEGGRWTNLGGVPFAVPVLRIGGRWQTRSRTTSFHKQLGIVQAFPVHASSLTFRSAVGGDEGTKALARSVDANTIYELIVRFTSAKALPDEDGSDGPREARLTPLVYGFDAGAAPAGAASNSGPGAATGLSLPAAAPFLQVDRLAGRFAGGRWVLATGDGRLDPRVAVRLVTLAACGPAELRVQPRYAGFHPGEPVVVSVSLLRPHSHLRAGSDLSASTRDQHRQRDGETRQTPQANGNDGGQSGPTEVHVRILDRDGGVAGETIVQMTRDAADPERLSSTVTLPIDSAALPLGLYEVRASVSGLEAATGLWIYDASMLRGGKALVVGRDYFVRDGQPFPVVGTTYMATDVHRRFLLEPNALVWERDFAAMAAADVNLVRTGIWTAWGLHADSDGRPTEETLRALEVFLLTARRHDVPVIFNLFAFVPATWGGGNPYLDRHALDAQKRFVGGIAARLALADDIAWDLINEPSFSSPARLWSTRPNYDTDEQAAWQSWLRETVAAPDDVAREALLHDRWKSVPADGTGLPAPEDFADRHLFGLARPNKAADYKRFAQAAFTGWVREMRAAIRANGNRAQLVTVGQDEGGQGDRPNPLIFGEAVDFTGTHTWWNNDTLLWDALMSKRPDRASLIEETGLMTYERADRGAWRTEAQARNLIERKLVLAFGGGAAGFVQWLWNTNVYMPIDNEAGIGLLRADGTAKPEFEAFTRIVRFVGTHSARFAGRTPEDVVIVVPQSQVYSVRDFGTAATQRAVRALEYDLHVPVRVLSEYAVDELRKGARLLVVPSPRVLTDAAWDALMAAAEHGAVVLVTGPADRDEYERPVSRLAALGLSFVVQPVAPHNSLVVDGVTVRVPFRGGKLERVERASSTDGSTSRLEIVRRGKGAVAWSPLPVELSDEEAATTTVYRAALRLANVTSPLDVTSPRGKAEPRRPGGRASAAIPPGVLLRPLLLNDSILYAVVNESDRNVTVVLPASGPKEPARISVPAERAKLVLVARRTGRVIGTT